MSDQQYIDLHTLGPHMEQRQRQRGLVSEVPQSGQNLPISLLPEQEIDTNMDDFSYMYRSAENIETALRQSPTDDSRLTLRYDPETGRQHLRIAMPEEPPPPIDPTARYYSGPTLQPATYNPARPGSLGLSQPVLATVKERQSEDKRPDHAGHVHDEECGCSDRDGNMSQWTDPTVDSAMPRPLRLGSRIARASSKGKDRVSMTRPPSSSARAVAAVQGKTVRTSKRHLSRDPSPTSEYSFQQPDTWPPGDIPSALPAVPTDKVATAMANQANARRDVSRGRQAMQSVKRHSRNIDFTPSGEMYSPHPSMFFESTQSDQPSSTARMLGQNARGSVPPPPPSSTTRPRSPSARGLPPRPNPKTDEKGGSYAWLMSCAGFLVIFSTWGLNTAFGVFQAYYATILLPTTSLLQIAWIGSIQLFLIFFLGVPIGVFMDRGFFRLFFNTGSLILVGSLFATSWCTQWWHFLIVQGFVTGIGMGLIFPSAVIVLNQWFELHQMGRATAVGAAGAPVGALVYIAVFRTLILRTSFANTMRIIAGIVALTLIPVNIIARQRRGHKPGPRKIKLAALNDGPYIAMTASFFFAFWGLYVTVYFLPLFAITQLHMPGSQASNLLLILSATNFIGRFLPGVMSDACTGPLNLVIPSAFLCALLTVAWIPVNSEAVLMVIAALYGFFSAWIQALYAPGMSSMTRGDPETMGMKSGVVFTVISLACLTGAPIAGALVDQTGIVQRSQIGEVEGRPYLAAQLFSGASMMIAAVCLVLARWLKLRWKPGRF